MTDYDLDGVTMNVVKTDANGVVNNETIFQFRQSGNVVTASYRGGGIVEGRLVGHANAEQFAFRYAQIDSDGNLDGGASEGVLSRLGDGRLRMVERFSWGSRAGGGENIFEEIVDGHA